MSAQRAPSIPTAAHAAVGWWYTLAYEDVPPARLAVSAAALSEFSESLAMRGQTAPATLIARVAREVTFAETERRTHASYAESGRLEGGDRYVWGFRRLSDALVAARANRRSDYHAYPHPQTLRESSLDRLYQRFPLAEYPRTTVYLFTGMRVCDDPRIGADPRADALVSALPALLAPEDWAYLTVCGFRQGVSLARVGATSRWLRVGVRALEEAWAEANGDAALSAADDRLRAVETEARDTLLRIAATEAPQRRDDEASAPSSPPAPGATRRTPHSVGKRVAVHSQQ